jgi:putative methionine-R-sulfoxide reductase with GAF domain
VTSSDLFEAVERIADRGGEATDVLQAFVATIVERGGATWAAVFFYDEGELIVGPHSGVAEPGGAARRRWSSMAHTSLNSRWTASTIRR